MEEEIEALKERVMALEITLEKFLSEDFVNMLAESIDKVVGEFEAVEVKVIP